MRYGGHLDDPDKTLYSFTYADQERNMIFGIDTTTPEGREEFKKEWDEMCQMAPELLKKDDIVYPHEMPKIVTEEPHFRRVWWHFRELVMRRQFAALTESGEISKADADAAEKFIELSNIPSVNMYIYGRLGQL